MAMHATRRPILFIVFALTLSSFALSGCDMMQNQLKDDRSGDMNFQDYRDGMAPRLPEVEEEDSGTIPTLQPYIAPSAGTMKSMPLVSVSVNQSVPLRDILYELAQQADYDLELDPRIRGSIIFSARERPLDQVVDRISDMAGLRYNFDDDVLRVEVDTPYNKTYKIDYLSYVRASTSTINNDVSVVQGEGTDTGSNFTAASESESDFWGELEVTLTQILGGASGSVLRTNTDPQITATEENPNVQPVAPTDGEGNVEVQPPDAVLRVETLPVNGGETPEVEETDFTFSMNRQGGMINVFANEKAHRQVQEYLKLLEKSITAQVLIEAKVLEVTLNDEHATGVNWRALDLLSGELAVNYLTDTGDALLNGIGSTSTGFLPSTGEAVQRTDSRVVLGYSGNDVQALVTALNSFGNVKALASPRLTVLNNQAAVLNVATNRVFFEIDIETTPGDGGSDPITTIDSEARNVPEGVLINVQPSIDLENRTVSLAVRPTITSIVNTISDPGVAFAVANTMNVSLTDVVSNIPELNVQELDSVIRVRSGQPVVMGGLLQDKATTLQDGVPILSEVPMFGKLFKQSRDRISKTELVIFLQATILDSPFESVHNTDKDLYRQFSDDRRPFKL